EGDALRGELLESLGLGALVPMMHASQEALRPLVAAQLGSMRFPPSALYLGHFPVNLALELWQAAAEGPYFLSYAPHVQRLIAVHGLAILPPLLETIAAKPAQSLQYLQPFRS